MTTVTIIGKGNMANAIGGVVASGGNTVEYVGREGDAINGEIVVFAVPYPEVDAVIATYGDALTGKTIVDITNPLDFATFDGLVAPAGSSAAASSPRRRSSRFREVPGVAADADRIGGHRP